MNRTGLIVTAKKNEDRAKPVIIGFIGCYFSPQIEICKNYLFTSGVVFLSVFFCNYLDFRINGIGSAVKTNIFQALGPVSHLCRALNFYDFTEVSKFPIVSMAQWVGQQRFETGPASNLCGVGYFLDLADNCRSLQFFSWHNG